MVKWSWKRDKARPYNARRLRKHPSGESVYRAVSRNLFFPKNTPFASFAFYKTYKQTTSKTVSQTQTTHLWNAYFSLRRSVTQIYTILKIKSRTYIYKIIQPFARPKRSRRIRENNNSRSQLLFVHHTRLVRSQWMNSYRSICFASRASFTHRTHGNICKNVSVRDARRCCGWGQKHNLAGIYIYSTTTQKLAWFSTARLV